MVNIVRTARSTRLFSAKIKDVKKIESQIYQKVSRTFALEKKLTILLAQIAIRNKNLQDPVCTRKVLIAMKEVIQYRLSQDSWKKIKNSVEGLLEQALALSEIYQYHQGLIQVEDLFDFLFEFHSINDAHLKTIEEFTIPNEIIFRKIELSERLKQIEISEENAFLWEAILSLLIEENKGDVENFEHPNEAIQDAVNAARRAVQETARVFSKYRREFFLIKVEDAFLKLSQSKFEKADMKNFVSTLSHLCVYEKFAHIREYKEKLEKFVPNSGWQKIISGFEKEMASYFIESEKIKQQKEILKYLNQLADSFEKYKKFPIAMIDALQGLVKYRVLLINSQEKNEKIKQKLERMTEYFEKIEKIYFKMNGKVKFFLENVRDECLIFLEKDNPEKEINKFFKELFEKIRTVGMALVESHFEAIRNYKFLLRTLIPSVAWDFILSTLKEKIVEQYQNEKETLSFYDEIELHLARFLDYLKILDDRFREARKDEIEFSLKLSKSEVVNQLIQIHCFLNTKYLVGFDQDSVAWKIKLSGISTYVIQLSSVRKDIQWGKMIFSLEENIKSSKKDCDECIEQALGYLENLRVGLMNISDVNECTLHQKYPACIEEIGDFLVFIDSLDEGLGDSDGSSKLLKIELDKMSAMLRNDYKAIFLKDNQKKNFIRIIEEIALQFLDETIKNSDAMKLFTIRLNALYLFIEDKDLNPKLKKATLQFLSEVGKLVYFRVKLLPGEGEEKKESLLVCEKIIKFLLTASKLPNNYLTIKFLNALEEQLLNLLPASKISIA